MFGVFAIPLLAPLVAGGAGITVAIFGALAGTLGAIVATISPLVSMPPRAGHKHTHEPGLVRRLPLYGAIALVLLMALTLWVIASHAIGAGEFSGQSTASAGT